MNISVAYQQERSILPVKNYIKWVLCIEIIIWFSFNCHEKILTIIDFFVIVIKNRFDKRNANIYKTPENDL